MCILYLGVLFCSSSESLIKLYGSTYLIHAVGNLCSLALQERVVCSNDIEVIAAIVLVQEVGSIVCTLQGIDLLVDEFTLLACRVDTYHGTIDFVASVNDLLYKIVYSNLYVNLGRLVLGT